MANNTTPFFLLVAAFILAVAVAALVLSVIAFVRVSAPAAKVETATLLIYSIGSPDWSVDATFSLTHNRHNLELSLDGQECVVSPSRFRSRPDAVFFDCPNPEGRPPDSIKDVSLHLYLGEARCKKAKSVTLTRFDCSWR